MAKIGYIYKGLHFHTLEEDLKWMRDYGCVKIFEEDFDDERERPRWLQMLGLLGHGDELVISRLSNAVRGTHEMAVFFELCRILGVRLISIHDRIDTTKEDNSLFPNTTIASVIETIATLPAETISMRKAESHIRQLKESHKKPTESSLNRTKREQLIVKMYNSGHTIEEIWKESGFSSRSSVFRILNKHNTKITRQRRIK